MATPPKKSNGINPEVSQKLIENIKYFEDYRDKPYLDTQKKLTIGYGINLDSPENREYIKKHTPYKVEDVISGKVSFSKDQADKYVRSKLGTLYNDVKTYHPNVDNYPAEIQSILYDMDYNMGPTKLAGFKKMNAAIQKGDYAKAAEELKNSNYFKQTGRRAKAHYTTLSEFQSSQPESNLFTNSGIPIAPPPIEMTEGFNLFKRDGGWVYPANTAYPEYRRGGRLTKKGKKRRKYGPRPDYMNQNPSGMTTGPITQRSIGNTPGGGYMSFGDGGFLNTQEGLAVDPKRGYTGNKEIDLLIQKYTETQKKINEGASASDVYVQKLRKIADELIDKGFAIEESDVLPKNILERDPKTGEPPAFCIGTACFLTREAGDPFFFTSNSMAQDYARDNPNSTRYLEQSEKYITPGDILQFKQGSDEKSFPHHAYVVYDVGEPNKSGERIVTVVGSRGQGPMLKKTFVLGKDNKVYEHKTWGTENDIKGGTQYATQLLKRKDTDSGLNELIKQRESLKKQINELDPAYFYPGKDVRYKDYKQTVFELTNAAKQNALTTNKVNWNVPETIDTKKSRLAEIVSKYDDPKYKYQYMRSHNISSSEYDTLVSNMIGIYGAETKFGTDYLGKAKGPEWPWLSKMLGDKWAKKHSVGPFQVTYNQLPENYRKSITVGDLYDPVRASEATLEYLTDGLTKLRKRSQTTPETATKINPYSQAITPENYLEYLPYLYNAPGWLSGDIATQQKYGDVLKGESDYKKLVDFYRNQVVETIPTSLSTPESVNITPKKAEGGPVWEIIDDRPMAGNGMLVKPGQVPQGFFLNPEAYNYKTKPKVFVAPAPTKEERLANVGRNAAKGTTEPMVGMDDPIFNLALMGYGWGTKLPQTERFIGETAPVKSSLGEPIGNAAEAGVGKGVIKLRPSEATNVYEGKYPLNVTEFGETLHDINTGVTDVPSFNRQLNEFRRSMVHGNYPIESNIKGPFNINRPTAVGSADPRLTRFRSFEPEELGFSKNTIGPFGRTRLIPMYKEAPKFPGSETREILPVDFMDLSRKHYFPNKKGGQVPRLMAKNGLFTGMPPADLGIDTGTLKTDSASVVKSNPIEQEKRYIHNARVAAQERAKMAAKGDYSYEYQPTTLDQVGNVAQNITDLYGNLLGLDPKYLRETHDYSGFVKKGLENFPVVALTDLAFPYVVQGVTQLATKVPGMLRSGYETAANLTSKGLNAAKQTLGITKTLTPAEEAAKVISTLPSHQQQLIRQAQDLKILPIDFNPKSLDPLFDPSFPNSQKLLENRIREGIENQITAVRSVTPPASNLGVAQTSTGRLRELDPRDVQAMKDAGVWGDPLQESIYTSTHVPYGDYGMKVGTEALSPKYGRLYYYRGTPIDELGKIDYQYGPYTVKTRIPFEYKGEALQWLEDFKNISAGSLENAGRQLKPGQHAAFGPIDFKSSVEGVSIGYPGQQVLQPISVSYNPTYVAEVAKMKEKFTELNSLYGKPNDLLEWASSMKSKEAGKTIKVTDLEEAEKYLNRTLNDMLTDRYYTASDYEKFYKIGDPLPEIRKKGGQVSWQIID